MVQMKPAFQKLEYLWCADFFQSDCFGWYWSKGQINGNDGGKQGIFDLRFIILHLYPDSPYE
jgi:hypothetical protein